jgi:hypothetical protein
MTGEPTEPPEDTIPTIPPDETGGADAAALRAILQERLNGRFVTSGEMRDRVEAMIADKRRG